MTPEEKYQALIEAQEYCDSHNISKALIKETSNSYIITKEFKF